MSGFLPPVVMKIMADGHQFITETGKVSAAMDAAAANARKVAQEQAAAAREAAQAAQAAADKQVAAAAEAAKAAEVSAAKVAEAQAKAAAAAQAAADKVAAAEAQGTEAAKLAADQAVAASEKAAAAAELAATRQENAVKRAAAAAELAAAKTEAAQAAQSAAEEKAAAVTEATSTRRSLAVAKVARGMAIGGGILAAGLVAVAVKGTEAASEFEKETTLLQTAGGELASNMKTVRDGILSTATATGTSTDELAKGMFTVEKAGFRGADGLKVLKVAAEGAKAENADMGTVTNALTSIMMSYHMKASDATSATNMLVAGAGAAKATMQTYAGSLSTVLPVASAAGISFAQVGGAIATLTQHGTSAEESTQELSNTIRGLQAPNQVAVKAMQQLGLNVNDLTTHLGSRGLTGTIGIVTNAIASHLGKGGTVLVDTMKKSATATQDLQVMMSKMPPSLASASKAFLDGSLSQKDYQKSFKDMGAAGSAQGKQFMSLAQTVKGYNDTIKQGGPAAKTAAAELKAIMGGATGMNTALMLSSVTAKNGGENMKMFKDKVKEVGDAGKKSGSDISTWAQTSQTLSVQMDKTKESFATAAIAIGTQLAPAAKAVMGAFQGLFSFFAQHKTIATALAVGLGVLAAGLLIAAAAVWVMNSALLANPVTWIIVGIVALIAAVVLLAANWKQVTAWISTVWGGFINWCKSVIDGFVNWWNQIWGGFGNWVGQVWGGMVNGAKGLWSGFTGWLRGAVTGVINWWNGIWRGLASFFTPIWNNIVNVVRSAFTIVRTVVTAGVNIVRTVFTAGWRILGVVVRQAWEVIQTIVATAFAILIAVFTGHWNMIGALVVSAWTKIRGFFGAALDAIIGIVVGAWTTISGYWNTAINAIVTFGVNAWNGFVSFMTGLWNGFVGWWNSLWAGFNSWITNLWNSIVSWGRNAWNGFINWLVALGNNFVTGFSASWNRLVTFLSQLWTNVRNGVVSAWNGIISWFRGIPGWIVGALGNLGSMLSGAGDAIMNGFLGGLKAAWQGVQNFVGGIGQWIKDHKGPISYDRTLLTPAGHAIMDGLHSGLRSKMGDLRDTVNTITGTLISHTNANLGIHSPSREFMKIGGWVTEGLAVGVHASGGKAVAAVKNLAARITGAATAHINKANSLRQAGEMTFPTNAQAALNAALRQGVRDGRIRTELAEAAALDRAAAQVRSGVARINQLANQKLALAAKLKDAQKRLNAAVATEDKTGHDMSGKLSGEFKLGDMVGFSATEMVAGAKEAAARISAFGAKITQLKNLGLSPALIQQVADLGSEDGTTVADQLIAGGRTQARALNAAYSSISASSSKAGRQVTEGLYGAGVNGLKGLVNGYTKDIASVDRAATAVANRLIKSTKSALGIHSPSRVMRDEVGFMMGLGIAEGLVKSTPHVAAKLKALTAPPKVIKGSGSSPYGLASGSGAVPVGGTKNVTNNVTVHAKGTDAKALSRALVGDLNAMS